MEKEQIKRRRHSKRQLRLSLVSVFFGAFGSQVLAYALSFRIYDQTHSALSFSVSLMVYPLVNLLVLPYVGPLVDRISRKKIIVISQGIMVGTLLIFAFYLAQLRVIGLSTGVILTFFLAMTDSFTGTAQMASRAQVMEESELLRFASYRQVIQTVLSVVVAVIGAVLYTAIPFGYLVLLEAFCEAITLLVTACLAFTFGESQPAETVPQARKERFKQGITYVKQQPAIKFVMTISLVVNGLGAITAVGIPVLVLQVAGGSKIEYAFVEIAGTAAALCGSWLVTKNQRAQQEPVHLLAQGVVLVGGTLMLIGWLPWVASGRFFLLLLALILVVTMGSAAYVSIPFNVWLQKEVPVQMQGRVFHLLTTVSLCSAPFCTLFYGWLFGLAPGKGLLVNSGTFFGSGLLIIAIVCWTQSYWHVDVKQPCLLPVEAQKSESIQKKPTS